MNSFSAHLFLPGPQVSCKVKKGIEKIRQVIPLQGNGSFKQQYYSIYLSRYQKLAPRFDGLNPLPISKLNGLCVISGILKKKYKKLLRKVGSKKSAMPLETQSYVQPFVLYDDQDIVEIQDETGKLQIVFTVGTKINYNPKSRLAELPYDLKNIPFGVVVAIEGVLDGQTGKFICHNFYFPCPQLQVSSINFSRLSIKQEEMRIVIASDLREKDYDRLINMFLYDNHNGKQYEVLILCGNLLKSALEGSKKYNKIDEYLQILSSSVNIVILPDNGGKSWPHKPLLPFFLKKSKNLVTCTHNPTILSLQDLQIVVTNGQNITESHRVCPLSDPLTIMQSHLTYNHLAPCCPSTFQSVPLIEDAFVLKNLPNLYIAARQSSFSTCLYQSKSGSCRSITVPAAQQGLVQINSKTMIAQLLIPTQ